MEREEQKLVIGSLLHDFGKLLFRYNDGRNHSTSGYEYLKDMLAEEKEILDCVRYHHGAMLRNSGVADNALCYITYIADNIAAAVDRRKREGDKGDSGFVRNAPYESVFNILNGNSEKMVYKPDIMSIEEISYPFDGDVEYNESFYKQVVNNIEDLLKGIEFTDEYINSLLQLLEINLTFVPSSTQTKELVDISLYDHLKLTAAFALCIKLYLDEKGIKNYKETLFDNSIKFYEEKAFLLYSLDLSGIQNFIYNISSKGALKGLRARSFYLEILLESSVDELLSRADLCRANVLYTGGGHTYIIMPATEKVKDIIHNFEAELNMWLSENFDIGLYGAGGYTVCSSDELKNKPEGSYSDIFARISENISYKKLNRYSSEDIRRLNSDSIKDYSRECSVCHCMGNVDANGECDFCSSLKKLSDAIISKGKENFFAVMKGDGEGVKMPFGYRLTGRKWEEMKTDISDNKDYVRAYAKNTPATGRKVAANLWVGDYADKKEFSELVMDSTGIKRLGVIRADVDNLGQAFVSGFSKTEGGKYETISRTAVFSRKLSTYFKLYINVLLENGEYSLLKDEKPGKRNAVIVYSGGDDLFIVGGWDDIIEFSVDLYRSFKKFSQGTLSFSAGIGIYTEKYPISEMAVKTGKLEDIAKHYDNESKNSIALFDENSVYHWDEFIDKVLGEKLDLLVNYFSVEDEHNKAMLYKMLELIRDQKTDNRLNVARFAYLIARLKPREEDNEIKKEEHKKFSKNMYEWIQNARDCKQLVTAIYILVYMTRKKDEV